jgi:hypothetical protein
MEQGDWLLLDHVNVCSSSVLDRLNSLLEPNGDILLTECVAEGSNSVRRVKPAAGFRLFVTMNSDYGEVSRAMRNRCIEICLLPPSPPVASPQDTPGRALKWTHDSGDLLDLVKSVLGHEPASRVPVIMVQTHERLAHAHAAVQARMLRSWCEYFRAQVGAGAAATESLGMSFAGVYGYEALPVLQHVVSQVHSLPAASLSTLPMLSCPSVMWTRDSALAAQALTSTVLHSILTRDSRADASSDEAAWWAAACDQVGPYVSDAGLGEQHAPLFVETLLRDGSVQDFGQRLSAPRAMAHFKVCVRASRRTPPESSQCRTASAQALSIGLGSLVTVSSDVKTLCKTVAAAFATTLPHYQHLEQELQSVMQRFSLLSTACRVAGWVQEEVQDRGGVQSDLLQDLLVHKCGHSFVESERDWQIADALVRRHASSGESWQALQALVHLYRASIAYRLPFLLGEGSLSAQASAQPSHLELSSLLSQRRIDRAQLSNPLTPLLCPLITALDSALGATVDAVVKLCAPPGVRTFVECVSAEFVEALRAGYRERDRLYAALATLRRRTAGSLSQATSGLDGDMDEDSLDRFLVSMEWARKAGWRLAGALRNADVRAAVDETFKVRERACAAESSLVSIVRLVSSLSARALA